MNKLSTFFLALVLIATGVAGTYVSQCFAATTIQVFDDAQGTNEYESGASLSLNTDSVTFPTSAVWPNVSACSVLKLFVKVFPDGNGWSIVMYTSNPYNIPDLYHSGDRTKRIPWKYGSELKGLSTPPIGATNQATWLNMRYMALKTTSQTVGDLVAANQGIIAADGDDDWVDPFDVTIVTGVHSTLTTSGTYMNNLTIEVYVP